ncbi:MAG: DUF373 family protein [Candidatus Micrarchaeota archaeon]
MKKKILVITVDIDDDLGEKARVRGPVVGREANIQAATKLAIADPEDADANTVFEAVKTFDELSKKNEAVVATLTGSHKLGYHADARVARQLEELIDQFEPTECVFISDGMSDEQIIPLINSRLKISSVKTVTVKQSKELEKTYFVILEKLREPHFARIVFGIPGIALLLFAFSEVLGVRLFLGLLGTYLLFKGTGLEDRILRRFSSFNWGFESIGSIFYFAAIPITVLAIWIAIANVGEMQSEGVASITKLSAFFVKDLLLLLPISIILLLVGRVLEALNEKKTYDLPGYVVYGSALFLFWMIFNNAADWIIGTVSFADFFYSLLAGVVAMFLVTILAREFKKSIISKMQLEGKEVYTEIGGLIGKVVGVKRDALVIKTRTNQKIDLSLEFVSSLGEKIVVRY